MKASKGAGDQNPGRKGIDEYRRKRDFRVTPEPPPGEAAPAAALRFVVQEHHATALHWDFRLERDGVLVSWAIPKGIPVDPKSNHRAIQTEDHPMEYLAFAGDIPKGEYGGGRVTIWDTGTYTCEKWWDDEVMVTLHGQRVQGRYILFRTKGKDWMIHRMDPPQDPTREPMPRGIHPMLATLATMPATPERYAFEIKWDGIRAIVYAEGGRVRAESRNRNDVTPQFPELRDFGRALGSLEVVLDGEIVTFDAQGRPSFELLQRRLGVGKESQVRRLREQVPIVYVVFDLLYLEGHSTMALPYTDRRRLLEELDLNGESWRTPRWYDDGPALVAATAAQGLEGVVAKRLDSVYEPGRRSDCWLKIKNHLRQELVIGGWTARQGSGPGELGALLLGYYDRVWTAEPAGAAPPPFRFAGRAGTGFTEQEAARVVALLKQREQAQCPFAPHPDIPKEARWVRPDLACEVEFTGWTQAGVLRHPSYKGLRESTDPREIVREDLPNQS